ncbi:MAG: DUF1700 domain-containing protein [Oscillospiraceae bacterium]|nr:DUF1700 domain-containing protein [Oscillospiraceae bacterium]
MTQKQYLSELSRHLRFRFSDSEIGDIISDIKECFEAGTAEGKSEDDICLSLGKPKDAAAAILNEQEWNPAGFAARLLDHYVPALISAFVLGIFFYFGFKHEIVYIRITEIALYAIPLLIWLLLERASLFKSILKYKADPFAFAGSALIFTVGIIYNIFMRSIIITDFNYRIPPLAVSISVLLSASVVMLVISIWKHAPRPFFFAAVIVSALSVYKLIETCHYFVTRFSLEANYSGLYNSYYYDLLFFWGALFLVWSLFRRSSLSLPSAYLSLVTVVEIFYIWQILSKASPSDSDNDLPYYAKNIFDSSSYLIVGGVLAAIMLAMVIIVKHTVSGKDDR